MLGWAHPLISTVSPYRLVGSQPYLETVRFRVILAFTVLQLCCLGAVYGVTWAGVSASKNSMLCTIQGNKVIAHPASPTIHWCCRSWASSFLCSSLL